MNRVFIKSMFKDNPQLLELALTFNLDAPDTVHDDWLSDAGRELKESGALEALRSSRRGHARMTELINALTGSSTSGWFLDFSTARRRLALLSPEVIQNLCNMLGLAINAKYVSRTIFRPQVQVLKASFGSRGYMFAVKRAPFLVGDCSQIVPEPVGVSGLVQRISEQGRLGFAICMAQEPQQMLDRLQFRLPAGFLDVPAMQGDYREVSDRIWPVIRTLLTKEVAPEWAPLFA